MNSLPSPSPSLKEPAVRDTKAHLTRIPGAITILAWLTTHDLQAVRMEDGSEALYLQGRKVNLDPGRHFHPTQVVINATFGGRRKCQQFLSSLANL